jgi:hypothetical protein
MKKSMLSILLISLLVGCRHETRDEKYQRQAREFTESSCPKPMDKYTVLDSLVYDIEGRVMRYHYSVSGVMDTASAYNSEMRALFHTNLLDNIRQNTGYIELKEHEVTFQYCYHSSTDTIVYMNFIFAPHDYR